MLQKMNDKNRDLIVNIDGALVHRDEPGISPFDSSVQNGDTVWEGLRLYRGRVFRLPQHLARIRKSAMLLSYENYFEDEWIVEQLQRTFEANRMFANVHVRLIVSRGLKYTSGLDPRINTKGCSLFILAEHKEPVYDKKGVTLVTAKQRRPFTDVLNQHIHSSNQLTSILAKLEANAAGVDDALMLDTAGHVAETNATHVFFVKDGCVLTPTTKACPEGITRAVVLEICEAEGISCEVRDISLEEAAGADEMFCTGTMGEIVPVTELDGRMFNDGVMGEMTRRLADCFKVLTVDPAEGMLLVNK